MYMDVYIYVYGLMMFHGKIIELAMGWSSSHVLADTRVTRSPQLLETSSRLVDVTMAGNKPWVFMGWGGFPPKFKVHSQQKWLMFSGWNWEFRYTTNGELINLIDQK